ncbi:hypothetical protein [Rhodovulum strictum]|uniref:Uncharacterized protein n=1 Tax=Rhodovulum strictum TaxID=58314 RepID=A0A844BJ10_9RHOB|nr:hypothetical protein [Rhodovulum strictum]MRH20953.1 hypothetical protein [Rhodovulum strictum]
MNRDYMKCTGTTGATGFGIGEGRVARTAEVIPLHGRGYAAPIEPDEAALHALDRLLGLLDETIALVGLSDNPAAQYHFDQFALEAVRLFADVTARCGASSTRR